MLLDFLRLLVVILFLFGAFQALLFLSVFYQRDGWNSPSFCWLTGLLLAITGVLLHHGYYAYLPVDWPARYWFNGLAATLWFAVPPCYLFYIQRLLGGQSAEVNGKGRYLLFLPAAFFFVNWLAGLLQWDLPWFEWLAGHYVGYLYTWVGGYVAVGLYCSFSVAKLLRRKVAAGKLPREAQWLRLYNQWFILALGATALIFSVLVAADRYSEDFEYGLLSLYAVFTIGVAYQSLRRSTYTNWLADRLYGEGAVTTSSLPILHRCLEKHMQEQRPYLNPGLRRADLSAATGIGEHELSQLFGRHLGSNFYAYVNAYRLRAFEKRLLDGSLEQMTMAALAEACGFRSKTSLYRVFKEKHGITPGEYLKANAVFTKTEP